MNKNSNWFSPAVKERVVRMVLEHQGEDSKHPNERNHPRRSAHERAQAREQELRRAKEILKLASAFSPRRSSTAV